MMQVTPVIQITPLRYVAHLYYKPISDLATIMNSGPMDFDLKTAIKLWSQKVMFTLI